jgi:hypothetical protein
VALVGLAGCARYPEVNSPEGLRLIAQLRTACSTANADRLAKAEERLERGRQEGTITEGEYAAFQRIVGLAREGQWQRAERACVAFQKAQLR